MSWSFVTFSGKFCKKRILFGGRYSSGIMTFGRLDTGTAPAPSTSFFVNTNLTQDKNQVSLSAAKRFWRNFALIGLVYLVSSGTHG